MRALLAVSSVLVLLVALQLVRQPGSALPGGAPEQPGAGAAESTTDERRTARGAIAGALVPQAPAPQQRVARAAAEPPFAQRSPPAATTPGSHATPNATAGQGTASAPGVRRFAPGSREHASAVGAAIAAAEYRDTVGPLARLYLASFVRVPDYEGLHHYIGERGVGIGLADIADEFAGSPEFHQRYGELDNRAFVERLLRNVAGDAAQAAQWIARLDAGQMTRGEVLVALSESPAFQATTRAEVFIAMAYAEALQRAPTPAELARWVAFLQDGGRQGAVLDALVRGRADR